MGARGWSARQLADAIERKYGSGSGVSYTTINRFVRGGDIKVDTLRKLQATLEAEGFEFLNTGRPGVRWSEDAPARWAEADAAGQQERKHPE
jgi:hypothetical protein